MEPRLSEGHPVIWLQDAWLLGMLSLTVSSYVSQHWQAREGSKGCANWRPAGLGTAVLPSEETRLCGLQAPQDSSGTELSEWLGSSDIMAELRCFGYLVEDGWNVSRQNPPGVKDPTMVWGTGAA